MARRARATEENAKTRQTGHVRGRAERRRAGGGRRAPEPIARHARLRARNTRTEFGPNERRGLTPLQPAINSSDIAGA